MELKEVFYLDNIGCGERQEWQYVYVCRVCDAVCESHFPFFVPDMFVCPKVVGASFKRLKRFAPKMMLPDHCEGELVPDDLATKANERRYKARRSPSVPQSDQHHQALLQAALHCAAHRKSG